MLLSSLNRLKYYISTVESGSRDILSDGVANDSDLLSWLDAVSNEIERELDRDILIKSRTEYFDTEYRRLQYFVRAYPVSSITSIYSDSGGLYDGSESEESDYYISSKSLGFVLSYPISFTYPKGLRIIYIGGLAYDPVVSVFATSSESGTWTVDKFVQGQTSKAMGYVSAKSTDQISIENLYGTFRVGEVLQEQDTEGTQGDADGAATIASITRQSLAEAHSGIVRACEMEIRYLWKHKLDLENESTQFEGTRRRAYDAEYSLQPETRMMLKSFKNAIL